MQEVEAPKVKGALDTFSESGHDKVCQVLLQAGTNVHASYNVSITFLTTEVLA